MSSCVWPNDELRGARRLAERARLARRKDRRGFAGARGSNHLAVRPAASTSSFAYRIGTIRPAQGSTRRELAGLGPSLPRARGRAGHRAPRLRRRARPAVVVSVQRPGRRPLRRASHRSARHSVKRDRGGASHAFGRRLVGSHRSRAAPRTRRCGRRSPTGPSSSRVAAAARERERARARCRRRSLPASTGSQG